MTNQERQEIEKMMRDDMHERMRYIQSFPEFWKEVADESAKNFPTIEYVPPTQDQQTAMEEMQRKWDQRQLERELKEYEKLDQYFKEHGCKMTVDIPIKYERAISAIQDLYEVHGAGGYGHIVFDDCNYDCVAGCLDDAIKSKYIGLYDDAEDNELTRKLSIKALELCKDFTEDEIEFCVIMYRAIDRKFAIITKP